MSLVERGNSVVKIREGVYRVSHPAAVGAFSLILVRGDYAVRVQHHGPHVSRMRVVEGATTVDGGSVPHSDSRARAALQSILESVL